MTPERLADALRAVLDSTHYRERAVQVGRELLAGGGAAAAADRLEALG
ncbi:hypothetical protein [Kitasatospora brasiliensis]|nr:hypothetical protein [Kitasatospora sp. K002]